MNPNNKPWVAHNVCYVEAGGMSGWYRINDAVDNTVAYTPDLANATLIVQAVNSHEALVEASKQVLASLDWLKKERNITLAGYENLRTALKLAGE